jgi:uncharacterized protein
MDHSLNILTAVAVTFFVAGVVKGVTGMGLPTVAMGALGTLMPPLSAASLLLIPSFVTNVWQLVTGPSFTGLIVRLWLMMLGILAGTLVGIGLLTSANTKWTTVGLGVALSTYAGTSLFVHAWYTPTGMQRWLSPIIGVLTGLISGGTGVFVIPAVPYLQSLGLSKDDLIQALGLSFTVSTIALGVSLAGNSAFRLGNLVDSGLSIVPALAGMWTGTVIRERISPATFRRWFLVCLLLLGIDLMIRPLF